MTTANRPASTDTNTSTVVIARFGGDLFGDKDHDGVAHDAWKVTEATGEVAFQVRARTTGIVVDTLPSRRAACLAARAMVQVAIQNRDEADFAARAEADAALDVPPGVRALESLINAASVALDHLDPTTTPTHVIDALSSAIETAEAVVAASTEPAHVGPLDSTYVRFADAG